MEVLDPALPLEDRAARLRAVTRGLRADIIRMLTRAGSGHPGGSLSAVDLIATLYLYALRQSPERFGPDRDRFILSKGHGVPALYAVLAHQGYFERELLWSLRQLGSPLQGHPDRNRIPAVEACTGSLGQGLSVALGVALGQQIRGSGARTWCMVGDGEIQEGQIWEAAMAAAKFEAHNLVVMLDYNHCQIDGTVEEVMPIEPLRPRWESFGWRVLEVDGHDHAAIMEMMDAARAPTSQPTFVICNTVKGKGVSFMEHAVDWHGKAPDDEQCARALAELQGGAA